MDKGTQQQGMCLGWGWGWRSLNHPRSCPHNMHGKEPVSTDTSLSQLNKPTARSPGHRLGAWRVLAVQERAEKHLGSHRALKDVCVTPSALPAP